MIVDSRFFFPNSQNDVLKTYLTLNFSLKIFFYKKKNYFLTVQGNVYFFPSPILFKIL